MIEIRKATPEDLPAILAMGEAMTQEGPWTVSFSPEVATERILASMDAGCCFVADAEGALAGIILGFQTNYWYSEEEFLGELALYVVPECRRLGIGDELLDYFEMYASQRFLPDIIVSSATGVADAGTIKMLERRGYTKVCTSMRKRL